MSSINNSHSGRGRDEASQLSGRIPKKAKSSPNHDAAADDATNTVPKSADSFTNASDDDPLDAIAKARMAMMKFQEILGEKPSHSHLADDSLSSSIGGTVAQVTDDPTKLNGEKEGDNAIDDEKEVALKEAKEKEEEEKKQKEEEKKRQEEDARQRQRIADGEAKRRAFKPKIATALDSLL